MKYLYFLLLFIIPIQTANSEVFNGIEYGFTLKDVKNKFPNATFEKLSPAWATKEDALYQITGAGIAGKIIIKFDDFRPLCYSLYQAAVDQTKNDSSYIKASEFYKQLYNLDDDDALVVSWVRWVPDEPIPLKRYISKYGNPEKKGFDDNSMIPYREWTSRGIAVYLDDNEAYVLQVDFFFTEKEIKKKSTLSGK